MGNDAFKGFNIREKYAALQGMPYIDKDDFTDEFEFIYELGVAPEFELDFSSKDKLTYYQVKVDKDTLASRIKNLRKSYGKMSNPDVSADDDVIYADLNQIAEAMARSLLQAKVISSGPNVAVITLAEVKNKTPEYIDTRVITEKIRTQLTKSGQVKFAVSISEMQSQEDELKRQNQSGLYKNESIAKSGNMSGAKFRIEGAISSITKQNKDIKDIYYIFNLSLVNIETGLIEWADEKEIRKIEQR
jgi:uncharacterized protein (TIGR02722 family)